MKAHGRKLFTLIKSLSKKEKKYLMKSFSKRGKRKAETYKKLFVFLDNSEEFESSLDVELLEAQGLPNHTSVLKYQLFNWILVHMHTYHHSLQTSELEKVSVYYWQARYLRQKRLSEASEICLRKAKAIAETRDLLDWKSMILEEESRRLGLFPFQSASESIRIIHAAKNDLIDNSRLRVTRAELVALLLEINILSRENNSNANFQAIQRIKSSKVWELNTDGLSPELMLIWYACKGGLAGLTLEMDKALEAFQGAAEVFRLNPEFAERRWVDYIGVVGNILLLSGKMLPKAYYAEHLAFFEPKIQFWREKSGEEYNYVKALLIYWHTKSIYLVQFGPEHSAQYYLDQYNAECQLKEDTVRVAQYPLIPEIKLNLCILFIWEGNIGPAQKLFNQVVNHPTSRSDYYFYRHVLLIQMLICYEKGDMEYINYLKHQLKYHEQQQPKETEELVWMIVDHILRLGNAASGPETIEALKLCRQEFYSLPEEERSLPTFQFFDWGEWLNLKLLQHFPPQPGGEEPS